MATQEVDSECLVHCIGIVFQLCAKRGIAVQTIKSIARRRWQEGDTSKRFSWYEPLKDFEALRKVVHWVLSQPNIFLNTSSDATLLPSILKAASEFDESITKEDLENAIKTDVSKLGMAPIFIRGVMDTI